MNSRSRAVATAAERGHERVVLRLPGDEPEETDAERRARRSAENCALTEFATGEGGQA